MPQPDGKGISRSAGNRLWVKLSGIVSSGSAVISSLTTGTIALTVKRLAGQSGVLFQVVDENNSVYTSIDGSGIFTHNSSAVFNQRIRIASTAYATNGGTITQIPAGSTVFNRHTGDLGGTQAMPASPANHQLIAFTSQNDSYAAAPVTLDAGAGVVTFPNGQRYYTLDTVGTTWFRYEPSGTVYQPVVVPSTVENPWDISEGKRFFRFCNAMLRGFELGTVTTGDIVLLGDSWVQDPYLIDPLRASLQTVYGDGGIGFVSFVHNGNLTGGVTSSKSSGGAATWTEIDGSSTPATAYGVDASCMTSTGTSCTCYVHDLDVHEIHIHYLKKPGGGIFTYSINGGAAVPVDTANATTELGIITVNGLDGTDEDIDFAVTSQGTNGVTLIGINGKRTTGIRVHRVGNGGMQASQYNSVDQTTWRAGLADLAPTLVICLFGTNEKIQGTTPAVYATALATLGTNIRAAIANSMVDLLFFAPSDNGRSGTSMVLYAQAARRQARTSGAMFYDGRAAMGAYSASFISPYGWYGNDAHENALGGAMHAANIYGEFLGRVLP